MANLENQINKRTPKGKSSFRIGLYIRVSTEEQAENPEGSIKNQEMRLRDAIDYKNRHGDFGKISRVFVDPGISAKDMKRPELQKLLQAIRHREIDLVMVTELSRLSRNTRDFIEMWDMMQDHDCSFKSLREDFDTTNAAGELVLFQLMNLAQFERRQTAERVEANIAARAARGLYNGGTVPIGYRLIKDKPGYLEIDPDSVETVRAAFSAYLREGCLSHAAKWLNEQGYTLKRHNEGGGRHKRNPHFTVDNLQGILRLKAYIGIKAYTHKGEAKEVKAVWPAIIGEDVFHRVGKLLDKNKNSHKPYKRGMFPYLLSGLTHCQTCKSPLSGKSATGCSGKVGYYEHVWATKRDSALSKKLFRCEPHRVPSKKLEPLVWEKLKAFVTDPQFTAELLARVKNYHSENPLRKDTERLRAKIYGVNSQIEALTERLSELPKGVSAAPIYKQLEKLQTINAENEALLERLVNEGSSGSSVDRLVPLETFTSFARFYRNFVKTAEFPERKKLAQKFIKKVEVGVDTVKIHFIVDKAHYNQELALAGAGSAGCGHFLKNNSSNTLTFGAPGRT